MDALKKAEQEKKEAAKRLEQASEHARLERTGEPPADITSEHAVTPASEPPSGENQPLSLEARSPDPGPEPAFVPALTPAQPAAALVHDTSPPLRSRELELAAFNKEMADPSPGVDPGDKTEVRETPLSGAQDMDQTFHGIQLPEAPPSGMYEETVQGEQFETGEPVKTYEETLPGVPALQFAKDIGGKDQPTPVAAQTVFTAGEIGRQSDSTWLKWAYIGLPLIVVVAGAVWYYYTVTPVSRNLPSPWVARGIETVVPGPSVPVPQADAIVAGTVTGPAAGVAVPESISTAVPVPATAEAAAIPADAAAPVPATTVQPETAAAQPAAGVAATTPPAVDEEEESASSARPAQPAFGSPPSLVRITRGKKPSDEGLLIKQAFSDYASGKLDAAKNGYMAVLTRLPDNVDALLGLGAIAMKEGDLTRALEAYTKVLRLEPRNETALAAMIGMQKDSDLQSSESALKTLLRDNQDNPYLYFTLGTVYAAQQRWAEAQQAFFDAYRNDSVNPDYALNLAVSLDRLGQHETALDYYNVALRLADDRRAGFDPSVVLARIQALSAPQATP